MSRLYVLSKRLDVNVKSRATAPTLSHATLAHALNVGGCYSPGLHMHEFQKLTIIEIGKIIDIMV